ncbi:hypothetical protein [Synechococcus sp. CS-1328]|uniref:hypothetical protein n=1 Tax=Synechococcus sp. CS-1328 TaxID=2847976 RepID=UPI00223C29D6|nr:hypothetical protein [Synechococcus sp. CS-1328]MCT0223691.1 hypothetical protein [Synechococcus sp. CS-1328]
MAANPLGAIPFVVTMSHNINLDKIKSSSEFLNRWYLQLLGDVAKGAFNLGSGNTINAAPGSGTELTAIRSEAPKSLSQLRASDPGAIYPYLLDPATHADYAAAYGKANAEIGKFFSSANKDILSDQSAFPALWLSDIQNGQFLFASQQPAGTLVNDGSGAPNPIQESYNYLLGELYVGLGPTGSNSNNGDITYIEQFGLPASLSV